LYLASQIFYLVCLKSQVITGLTQETTHSSIQLIYDIGIYIQTSTTKAILIASNQQSPRTQESWGAVEYHHGEFAARQAINSNSPWITSSIEWWSPICTSLRSKYTIWRPRYLFMRQVDLGILLWSWCWRDCSSSIHLRTLTETTLLAKATQVHRCSTGRSHSFGAELNTYGHSNHTFCEHSDMGSEWSQLCQVTWLYEYGRDEVKAVSYI
jgi:hypothetical protein